MDTPKVRQRYAIGTPWIRHTYAIGTPMATPWLCHGRTPEIPQSRLDLLEKTMNKELRKVDKWLTTNRLALNVDKSHCVLLHSSSNIPHRKIRIKIRNKKITEKNDVRDEPLFF